MKKKIAIFLALLLVLTVFCFSSASCSSTTVYSEGEGELKVLCTVFAPFDFTREVGGERVTISILQDSGADLHNYTPTAATLDALSQADLFIYIGGVSDEAWLPDALRAAGNEELVTLCLMDHISPVHAELENDWQEHDHEQHGHTHHSDKHEGHHHESDEHIWTSVKNAKIMVTEICNALTSLDADGTEYYKENANAYLQKLDTLDGELEAVAANIPFMLFADRFPFVYLLHDYHIPYRAAFSGCSTEINAGFETQIDLIERVRLMDKPCIFTIEGGDKHLSEAIKNETGCAVYSLDSMQSVKRSDIESGASYLKIMEKNVNILKEAYYGID